MRQADNIKAVAALAPDYMGFIFYEKSKRFAGDFLDEQLVNQLPSSLKKVGVFVNQSIEYISQKAAQFGLSIIQLHGDESANQCAALKKEGFTVIKAFQIDPDFNFDRLEPYKNYSDYFLFDTKSDQYGGTGKTFDWSILSKYDNQIPLFLSGGIGIEQLEGLKNLASLNLHALDINSKFELEPALKDVLAIKKFSDRLRSMSKLKDNK